MTAPVPEHDPLCWMDSDSDTDFKCSCFIIAEARADERADLRAQVQARLTALDSHIAEQPEPHPHQLGQQWAYGDVLRLLDGGDK